MLDNHKHIQIGIACGVTTGAGTEHAYIEQSYPLLDEMFEAACYVEVFFVHV
jgi:hypothetical protein